MSKAVEFIDAKIKDVDNDDRYSTKDPSEYLLCAILRRIRELIIQDELDRVRVPEHEAEHEAAFGEGAL